MTALRFIRRAALLGVAMLVLVVACGGGGETEGSDGGEEPLRIAAVFSGATTDADYTSLGLVALQEAEETRGAEVTFSENVAVPDVERVIGEYLAGGYDVIWTHGSQFYEATAKLAEQNPDVAFIGEFDAEPENQPENVWVLDRNFHVGFYPIGVLAAGASKSGTIGYVGGLSLPFSYSEVHAMEQAIADTGSQARIVPVWTGDFNDPAKAQQITTQLINQGADVIVSSLNLGTVGAFQAAKERPAGSVIVTAKYTDKSQFGPEYYATSVLYDFAGPLSDVLDEIESGQTQGYLPMGFDTGVEIPEPQNVDPSVVTAVTTAVSDVQSEAVTVEKNLTPIG